jgi:hypothetical protein
MLRVRETATGKHRHIYKDAIWICGVVPEKELVRWPIEIVCFALRSRKTCVHVRNVGLHAPDRVGSSVSNKKQAILATRSLEHKGSKLTVVKSLVALDHRGNFAHFDRRLLLRIRLNLKDGDRMRDACAVGVSDVNTVARDAESPAIARTVQIASTPVSRTRIAD